MGTTQTVMNGSNTPTSSQRQGEHNDIKIDIKIDSLEAVLFVVSQSCLHASVVF